jgi:hypothetical protein
MSSVFMAKMLIFFIYVITGRNKNLSGNSGLTFGPYEYLIFRNAWQITVISVLDHHVIYIYKCVCSCLCTFMYKICELNKIRKSNTSGKLIITCSDRTLVSHPKKTFTPLRRTSWNVCTFVSASTLATWNTLWSSWGKHLYREWFQIYVTFCR